MSKTVYIRSGRDRYTVVSYKPFNTQIYVKVFKLWLSVQQNIGLYNIVELATTAIATAASATTTSSTTTYLLCKSCYNQFLANSSNLVSMATRVGGGRIWVTPFNRPSPKTPCYTQGSRRYLSYKPSYSQFWQKFCCLPFGCHGNQGWSW